jgi:hypothetical protein
MWGAGIMGGDKPYVKTLQFQASTNTLYVGGSFTSINGVTRKAVAAFSATSYALRPWAPVVNGGTIRDIEVTNAGVVYLAGNGGVGAYRADTAAKVWYVPATGGVVHSLLLSPDQSGLYAGGLFTALGGVPQKFLAEIFPLSTGAVFTRFAPNMGAGQYPLKLRWDTGAPQLRLIAGVGGTTPEQSIQSLDPYFGGKFWSYNTEGDTQAVAVLGNTILSGHHRSHGNQSTGCPFVYFGTQWANSGFVLPWDPGLNNGTAGKSTPQSVASEANGGISDILVEPQTRKVFIAGDFTAYGGTCDYATTAFFYVPCTGSTPLRGVAVYSY